MAKQLYLKFKENCLLGNIPDLTGANKIKCALVDDSYAVADADEFYVTDVSTDEVGTPQILDNITVTDGEFETGDATTTFTAVSGNTIGAIVIYYDGTQDVDDYVIYHDDTLAGLDLSANGQDIIITWDTSPSYIFAI